MNDEYRLGYCKVCDNKKFDPERGLVCRLTNDKPIFMDSCDSYISSSTTGELFDEKTISRMVVPVSSGKRFLHMIIDMLALYGAFFGLFISLGAMAEMMDSDFYYDLIDVLEGPMSYVIDYGSLVSFYMLFEYLFMQTPGKMLTKTIVVDGKGDKLSFGKTLGRSFMRLVPFDGLSFLSSSQRGWHDKVVNAYVITKDSYDQIQELKKERESNRLITA